MSPNVLWAAAAAVIVLSSCGSPSAPGRLGPDDHHPAYDSQTAEHNATDVSFAQNMIPHHQQAVDMAAMVPSRSTDPDVRVMATHISSDQQAEILTMTGLLAQWGVHGDADHGDHSGMPMAGMVDSATLSQIRSTRGSSFDALWLTSMISHHRGAIVMAQNEIARGRSSDAVELAEMIIIAQQREIAQMNLLLNVTE